MYWRFLSSTRIERLAGQALRNNSTFIALNKRDFKELGRYQRSPALSDVLETITQWCSKPPKGFEKFFKEKPGSGSKPTKSTTKEAPKEAKKSQPKPDAKAELQDFFKLGQRGGSKGGSGGGGAGMGGFGNMPDAEKQRLASMVGLGVVGVLAMIYMNQMNYRYVMGK